MTSAFNLALSPCGSQGTPGSIPLPAGSPCQNRHMVVIRLLEEALRRAVSGEMRGEVRFDAGAKAAYASDASNYRQVPLGVVLPRSSDDIVAAVAACREHAAPILARGGGTSLCGQAVNVAVVIDASKYLDRVLELDAGARLARVEPGVVCDALRASAERYG